MASRTRARLGRPVLTYGLVVATVAIAGVARWLLDPLLRDDLPFFTFYFAVLLAAWWGGLRPGLVSLALGIVAGEFFFMEPRFQLSLGNIVHRLDIARFAIVGTCVSLVCEQLHVQGRRAEARGELMRITLGSIGDAVITTDTEGHVTSLNGVASTLTGWTQDEAAGRPLGAVFRILNEETRRPVESPADRALREGVVVGLANHTVLVRKDGTELPIDDSAAPIVGEEGVVSGCVLIFRDVSERRRTERRIVELMAELKDADRRKDEFLATLAHELRNPLAPLRNMVEVLKRADGDPGLHRQAVETMERQLGQMVRLVDDLLDVGRITRDRLELRMERVELGSVVAQAIEGSRPLAEAAGHRVRVALPPDPAHLHADPVRLVQVLGNLLQNSCKYTPPGGTISIEAQRQGGEVVVTVADTGVGIPSDKLEGIFDMFAQVDRSPERSQGGLGIGLTLVKRLVRLHGGSIEARSEGDGKGSTFAVRLPVLAPGDSSHGDSSDGPISRKDASTSEPGPGRGVPRGAVPGSPRRRILVVDDNRDSADSLAMLLRMTGNETATAHDGLEALRAVLELDPDVVILDIGLPQLNGHDVCRRVRSSPGGEDVVLIALTGWGQEEDRRKSEEAGFDGHLTKPVDHEALMRLLESVPPRASRPGTP